VRATHRDDDEVAAPGCRRSESIPANYLPSGGGVPCSLVNFLKKTGLHVENKTAHRDIF
jgi:hypothetical protein